MGKGLIFFSCACFILVLTIVNLSIGPIITNVDNSHTWGVLNCEEYKDDVDRDEDDPTCDDDCLKYGSKWNLKECQRQKGMHDMEYTAFIFDIVIGFVCGLLGLLHQFDLKKDFVSNTGLIGLCCGIVGFVLTLVYVIFNGLVFTTYDTTIYKRDGDNAFAERVGSTNNFKCLYYEKNNPHEAHATISELNKKQYNYDYDLIKKLTGSDCVATGCASLCETMETFDYTTYCSSIDSDCKNIYYSAANEITYKDMFDRFLTTLILSLFVCLANIGLALFGFLLFRTPGDF